jgi:serine/threonine protein kinase
VFGRYVLESLAGRGGMGVVWKARDERLNRWVALKLLLEVVAEDPEAVRDLLRETNRCLELTHPHIVRVYDLVQDGPLAAIAMEYVDGESLAKRKAAAQGGCLTLAELRPLMEQLCTALDYAHRVAKVVHRDLKPANLLLTKGGAAQGHGFRNRAQSERHAYATDRAGGEHERHAAVHEPAAIARG